MKLCRECGEGLVREKNWKSRSYICVSCKAEYDRKWRVRHAERIRVYQKEYRRTHQAQIAATRKIWYARANNKERVGIYRRMRRAQRGAILNRYKRLKGCLICRERCVACLDFHAPDGHLDYHPTTMILSRWARVKAELFRCVVVCANCHRKLHAGLIELPKGVT